MVVTRIDVAAGEGNVGEGTFHSDVTEQAKHRRQLHPDRDAANLPIVDGDHLDLALEEQGDGLLPGDDSQGLVGRIEDERLLHERVPTDCPTALRALSRCVDALGEADLQSLVWRNALSATDCGDETLPSGAVLRRRSRPQSAAG